MDDAEYARMARVEDRMWWFQAIHALVIQELARTVPADGVILDAGCGTGGLLRKLTKEQDGRFAVGLDVHPDACAAARDRTSASIVSASVDSLPFRSDAFDAIVSIDVLCHRSADQEAALREFRRCLKPGGLVVLNLPAFRWMMSAHDRRVHSARRYTRQEVSQLLEESGFTAVTAGYWNSLLFPAMVVRRKLLAPADANSDVMEYPPAIERFCSAVTGFERWLLGRGMRFPAGGSVIAVGRRSAHSMT